MHLRCTETRSPRWSTMTPSIAFVFPVTYALIALLGTGMLAVLIMLAPLRRAARLKSGEAIRYA